MSPKVMRMSEVGFWRRVGGEILCVWALDSAKRASIAISDFMIELRSLS